MVSKAFATESNLYFATKITAKRLLAAGCIWAMAFEYLWFVVTVW